jgi:hypothetical protein
VDERGRFEGGDKTTHKYRVLAPLDSDEFACREGNKKSFQISPKPSQFSIRMIPLRSERRNTLSNPVHLKNPQHCHNIQHHLKRENQGIEIS